MSSTKQSVHRVPHRTGQQLLIRWPQSTPHWKAGGEGYAFMEVHPDGRGMSIDAREVATGKRDHEKRVMLHLDRTSVTALREYLDQWLAETTEG